MRTAPLDDQLDAITEVALAGDVEGALAATHALLREAPESGAAWHTVGTILCGVGRWAEADDALARAVEHGAATAAAYLTWARALQNLGRASEAEGALRRAHELAPGEAVPLAELGTLLYEQRRYDEAEEMLQRALARAPSDARMLYGLGLCEEARQHPAAAIAAYRRAIAADPRFTAAHKTMADLLASLGELEEAMAVLAALLRVERTNERAAHNRDVLARAMREMRARRLLGKGEREWQLSAVVHEGGLKKLAARAGAGEPPSAARYGSSLADLHITFDGDGRTVCATLLLVDAERATRKRDTSFAVTIVGKQGEGVTVDYATAISLTFLRESLGVPMTEASRVYARALARDDGIRVGGARVAFVTLDVSATDAGPRHGLRVET